MKINIKNPHKLEHFVERSITSWKIQYIGQIGEESVKYYYILTNKQYSGININVEIYNETQEMYDVLTYPKEQWVKIYCKNANQPLARGCTKFLRVEDFKDVRRVFNQIHDGGRQVLQ